MCLQAKSLSEIQLDEISSATELLDSINLDVEFVVANKIES